MMKNLLKFLFSGILGGIFLMYLGCSNQIYQNPPVYAGVLYNVESAGITLTEPNGMGIIRRIPFKSIEETIALPINEAFAKGNDVLLLRTSASGNCVLTKQSVEATSSIELPAKRYIGVANIRETDQGYWISIRNEILFIDRKLTGFQVITDEYNYGAMSGNLLTYKDRSILYLDMDKNLIQYPERRIIRTLEGNDCIAGWAVKDRELLISATGETYREDLQGNRRTKVFSHAVQCQGSIGNTSLLVLIPSQPGHPSFIDVDALWDNLFRAESVYEYQPFLYNAETDTIKVLPSGKGYWLAE